MKRRGVAIDADKRLAAEVAFQTGKSEGKVDGLARR